MKQTIARTGSISDEVDDRNDGVVVVWEEKKEKVECVIEIAEAARN